MGKGKSAKSQERLNTADGNQWENNLKSASLSEQGETYTYWFGVF